MTRRDLRAGREKVAAQREVALQALRDLPPALRDPRVIERLDAGACPPWGGFVVWSPRGSGWLHWQSAVHGDDLPPVRPGGVPYRRRWLMAGEVPLLLWHSPGCETCEQLFQSGVRSPDLDRQLDALRAVDVAAADDERLVEALLPLLERMVPGVWLVTLQRYRTRDAAGRSFWDLHDRTPTEAPAAARIGQARLPLEGELLATQPRSCFRPEARLDDRPGVALFAAGRCSAVLDGHHRALAAPDGTWSAFTLAQARMRWEVPPRRAPRPVAFTLLGGREVPLPPTLAPWARALARVQQDRWVTFDETARLMALADQRSPTAAYRPPGG